MFAVSCVVLCCVVTRVCEPDHEKFPLSWEVDEYTPKLLVVASDGLVASDDLGLENGDPKLKRLSGSEQLERRVGMNGS